MMKALVFRGPRNISLEDVPIPTIEQPTDAIVCITLCGLCGSDMHPYHAREQGIDHGCITGHEFVGTIHELGSQVQNFILGQRVMSPFTTNCGRCFYCDIGLTARCKHSQLLGWRENNIGLHGAQAQYIRVPMADATLKAFPLEATTGSSSLTDIQGLLLGDVFSTGFFSVENSGIIDLYQTLCALKLDSSSTRMNNSQHKSMRFIVAVVGCGPVGCMAVASAAYLLKKEAKRNAPVSDIPPLLYDIVAIDSIPHRLELASHYGATVTVDDINNSDAIVRSQLDGRGADVVIEAVGLPAAFDLACRVVRPGGVVSVAGCHSEAVVPLATVYNKNLTINSGRCSARYFMDVLLPIVTEFDLDTLITHRLPLTPEAYRLFDSRSDGVVKVVMDPWSVPV